MSVTGRRGVGIPTIILHNAEGTVVTIELKSGETYRGTLDESEDNMNCVMKMARRVDAFGKESNVDHVYIRGSQISFIVMPDMLVNSPVFKRLATWKRYHGCIPVGIMGGAKGQAGAIMRKAHERQQSFGRGRGGGGPPGGGGGFGGGFGRPPAR
jgi:small nuclear ribonucleoprotein D3